MDEIEALVRENGEKARQAGERVMAEARLRALEARSQHDKEATEYLPDGHAVRVVRAPGRLVYREVGWQGNWWPEKAISRDEAVILLTKEE